MGAPFAARIVAPDRVLFDGEVEQISCRTKVGEIGVLARHIALVGALDTCRVTVSKTEGGTELFGVKGGFVEVRDNVVTLLATSAVAASEADAESARTLRQAAQDRLDAGDAGAADDASWADLLIELSGS